MVNNTEKNEQQAIHYPFSGFYRKLLPTAETDTTEEQTAHGATYGLGIGGNTADEFSKTDADSMQQASIKSRYNGKV